MIRKLWEVAYSIIRQSSVIWEWFGEDLNIDLSWFKIPIIFPEGFNISLGISPFELLMGGILTLFVLLIIKAVIPVA